MEMGGMGVLRQGLQEALYSGINGGGVRRRKYCIAIWSFCICFGVENLYSGFSIVS